MKAIRCLLASIRKADTQYNLIQHGDKIVIGLSGGKDSVALTYCLYLYQKFSHTDFVIQPVMLDLGFPSFSSYEMNKFCESLNLKLMVIDSREVYKILTIQQKDSKHLPCSICSRMKKAAINKVANKIGFNKVAFAHHMDDAVETLFMNEIYGGRIATFSPKMKLERADITFIRPLIHAREKEIIRLIKEENLPVSSSCCPADKNTTREDIKTFLSSLYGTFPSAKENFEVMLTNYEKEDIWGKEIFLQIDQKGLSLKPITTPYDMSIANYIRNKVFVEEQGCSLESEFILKEEKEAKHFLIMLNEAPIGTIRYRNVEGNFKVERFALLKEYRRQGYGQEVFSFLVNLIVERNNPCTIILHAQEYIIDFYKNFGFEVEGDIIVHDNIKHRSMKRSY